MILCAFCGRELDVDRTDKMKQFRKHLMFRHPVAYFIGDREHDGVPLRHGWNANRKYWDK